MANPAFRPQCTEFPLADGFSNDFIEVTLSRVASTEFAGMLPGGRKGTCGTIRFPLAGWNHVSAGSQNRTHSLDRIRQPSRHSQLYQQRAACQVSDYLIVVDFPVKAAKVRVAVFLHTGQNFVRLIIVSLHTLAFFVPALLDYILAHAVQFVNNFFQKLDFFQFSAVLESPRRVSRTSLLRLFPLLFARDFSSSISSGVPDIVVFANIFSRPVGFLPPP